MFSSSANSKKNSNQLFAIYTPTKKYPDDRDFRSRFLTRLVDLSTEGLMLQKNFI